MTELDPHSSEKEAWLRRADAIGKAQVRYLWTALVVGLFFFALRYSTPQSKTINVPVIDLDLGADVVLAAGGAVLAFLLVVILGSLRAWGDAMEAALGPQWRVLVEKYDMHPTAFDLAHYTARKTPRANRVATFALYPTFLLLVWAESAWLQVWLILSSVPGRAVFLLVGAPLWVWATPQLASFWWTRIKERSARRAS